MDTFFLLSKLLTLFLFPLPVAIIFGLYIALFKINGYKNKFYSAMPIFFLWLFSSFFMAQKLSLSLELEFDPIEIESIQDAEVAIILGGMINPLPYHTGRVELLGSAERLTESVILYKKKKVKKILFTGGSGILFSDEVSEAKQAEKFLLSMGVPSEDIILESKSRNTVENALFTKEILQDRKISKSILVTSAFHMKRSYAIFKKLNIDVSPFPVDYRSIKSSLNWDVLIPSVGALETSSIMIKEWVGIFVYELKGFL
jgi:uncharacterized SAM-binding protein YcdF (DUF218 family)